MELLSWRRHLDPTPQQECSESHTHTQLRHTFLQRRLLHHHSGHWFDSLDQPPLHFAHFQLQFCRQNQDPVDILVNNMGENKVDPPIYFIILYIMKLLTENVTQSVCD